MPFQRNLVFIILFTMGASKLAFAQGEVFEGKLQRVAPQEKREPFEKQFDDKAKRINKKVDEIQNDVDNNEDARRIASSILNPIYQLAENMSFAGFYWVAFALMFAGVVNFALQIALGKLFMLAKFHFSLVEIFSDSLCLLMSVVGLVLTTQAATENSTFTQSAFSVLSAAALGGVIGFFLFIQGVKLESQAAESGKPRRRRRRRYDD